MMEKTISSKCYVQSSECEYCKPPMACQYSIGFMEEAGSVDSRAI